MKTLMRASMSLATIMGLAKVESADAFKVANLPHIPAPPPAVTRAPDFMARDDEPKCTALPKMCTGEVTLAGLPTSLTYICPKTTGNQERITVMVTVTDTVTVPPTPGPSAGVKADTTTTVREERTRTLYQTITVHSHRVESPPMSVPATSAQVTTTTEASLISEITASSMVETSTPNLGVPESTDPSLNSTTAFPTLSPSDSQGIFPTMSMSLTGSLPLPTGTHYGYSYGILKRAHYTATGSPNSTSTHPGNATISPKSTVLPSAVGLSSEESAYMSLWSDMQGGGGVVATAHAYQGHAANDGGRNVVPLLVMGLMLVVFWVAM